METTPLDPDRVEKELADVTNAVTFDNRPFIQDFAQGRVPKENLARFAASYCFQVDQFKRFVAQVYANAELQTGNLPMNQANCVHAVDDVSIVALGPGSERVNGVLDNTDVFFVITNALGIDARKG